MTPKHHSPSSLNLFAASPSMYVLERVIGRRQPVGAPAFRGTAVERGIELGLMDPKASLESCAKVALEKYDAISALSLDARRDDFRKTIPDMVARGLEMLRPYGVPTTTQGFIEWKPEGLQSPIIGYFDFQWDQHGITIDLKTSEKLAGSVKVTHARQIAFYVTSNNADARICYVTPKKGIVYSVDNIDAHREALKQIALRCERFLSLFDDPKKFTEITVPDLESYFWSGPEARQLAFEHWGV